MAVDATRGPGGAVPGGPGAEPPPLTPSQPAAREVERPTGRLARSLELAASYQTRRLTAHGAKLSSCPAMIHALGAPPIGGHSSRPIEVNGQHGWAHDEGHPYGTFHTFDALSVGGKAPHKVHVLWPRDYASSGRSYRVLYMHDGGNVFFPGAPGARSLGIADTMSVLKAEGRVDDLIVVAIHPRDRALEYLTGGKAHEMRLPEFTEWVANDLGGFIDGAYRTVREPGSATVMGSSHGGFAAFYMATRRPDRFGAGICMSSSFWRGLDLGAGGGALEDSGLVAPVRELLADATRRPKLWIDWGLIREGGYHNDTIERLASERGEEMADLLVSRMGYREGVDLMAVEDPHGGHDEDAWRRRMFGALEALHPKV